MKALVLAAGKGTRLESYTEHLNKCMIKVHGKPIIENLLADLSRIDFINEIVIVVGYHAEEIINYFGTSYNNKVITYVIQRQLKGLVNAMESAQEYLHGEDFLLTLGDEVMIKPKRKIFIEEFKRHGFFSMLGALQVENLNRIKKTYTFIHDERKLVYRLIEKPQKPLNNLMGTGNVLFKNTIFDYIESTPVHPERGEKELPDLIQTVIDSGQRVGYFEICDEYNNINTVDDLEDVLTPQKNLVNI